MNEFREVRSVDGTAAALGSPDEIDGDLPQSAANWHPMRVLGIDCENEVTGFAVVESRDDERQSLLVYRAMGAIRLKKALTTAARPRH
jgi:hypothetical protein